MGKDENNVTEREPDIPHSVVQPGLFLTQSKSHLQTCCPSTRMECNGFMKAVVLTSTGGSMSPSDVSSSLIRFSS